MSISARNVFKGKISAVKSGPINAEVELSIAGGDRIVAVVTQSSVESLGLVVGKEAVALVKAPWVIIVNHDEKLRFTARNYLPGTVSEVIRGAINCEVTLQLGGGSTVCSIITNEAAMELGIAVGQRASALFKASHVILGVSD